MRGHNSPWPMPKNSLWLPAHPSKNKKKPRRRKHAYSLFSSHNNNSYWSGLRRSLALHSTNTSLMTMESTQCLCFHCFCENENTGIYRWAWNLCGIICETEKNFLGVVGKICEPKSRLFAGGCDKMKVKSALNARGWHWLLDKCQKWAEIFCRFYFPYFDFYAYICDRILTQTTITWI